MFASTIETRQNDSVVIVQGLDTVDMTPWPVRIWRVNPDVYRPGLRWPPQGGGGRTISPGSLSTCNKYALRIALLLSMVVRYSLGRVSSYQITDLCGRCERK